MCTCRQMHSEIGYLQWALSSFCGDIVSPIASKKMLCHPRWQYVSGVYMQLHTVDLQI